MNRINLAISPCPNDTFIFDAIFHRRVDLEGLEFDFTFHDVETLNQMARGGKSEMLKVSFFTYLQCQQEYTLLGPGSALGFGNGPLLISKRSYNLADVHGLTVAIPGRFTTAHLLFSLAFPLVRKKQFVVFSEIEKMVLEGIVDAGVIIHENRFTYEQRGLSKIIDLGSYWEEKTGLPIPLGGIVARTGLGKEMTGKLNRILHRSVEYAINHPEVPMPFVRQHAQEMDEEVMKKHIRLYVNEFTLDPGDLGRRAVEKLREVARENGLLES